MAYKIEFRRSGGNRWRTTVLPASSGHYTTLEQARGALRAEIAHTVWVHHPDMDPLRLAVNLARAAFAQPGDELDDGLGDASPIFHRIMEVST